MTSAWRRRTIHSVPFEHRAILVRGDDTNGGAIDATVVVDTDGRALPAVLGGAPASHRAACVGRRPAGDRGRAGRGGASGPALGTRGDGGADPFYCTRGCTTSSSRLGGTSRASSTPATPWRTRRRPSLRGLWTKSPGAVLETRVGRVLRPRAPVRRGRCRGGDVWMAYHGWGRPAGAALRLQPPGAGPCGLTRYGGRGGTPEVAGPTTTPQPVPVVGATGGPLGLEWGRAWCGVPQVRWRLAALAAVA